MTYLKSQKECEGRGALSESESLNGRCGVDQTATERLALVSASQHRQALLEGKGSLLAKTGFGSQEESWSTRLPEELFPLCVREAPDSQWGFSHSSCSGFSRGWAGDRKEGRRA